MVACIRCHGSGVEPSMGPLGNTIITIKGATWWLHPTRTCPVCKGRLMLGDPAHNSWHCSALKDNEPEWIGHFQKSMLTELIEGRTGKPNAT